MSYVNKTAYMVDDIVMHLRAHWRKICDPQRTAFIIVNAFYDVFIITEDIE